MPKRGLAPRILCAVVADADAPGAKTEAVKDGIAPLEVALAETGTIGVVTVPLVAT